MLMQFTVKRVASLSSFSRPRKEFLEVSNAALKSSNQWCWSAAAVSSNSFSSQGRKKVTKQERSAMVLAFVEKYRTLNGGKFPTVSCTKKQVGGSFYVLREIIQELQHNHKKAPVETKKEFKIREEHAKCEDFSSTKEPCILADAKQNSFRESVGDTAEVRKHHSRNKSKGGTKTSSLSVDVHSANQIEVDADRHLTPLRFSEGSQQDNGLSFDKLHVHTSPATVEPQTHTSGRPDTQALNVGQKKSAKLETKTSILHSSTEERKVRRKNASSASNLHEEAFISEELYNGQRQAPEKGEPSTNISNFWGNLKSIAIGIISIWKK